MATAQMMAPWATAQHAWLPAVGATSCARRAAGMALWLSLATAARRAWHGMGRSAVHACPVLWVGMITTSTHVLHVKVVVLDSTQLRWERHPARPVRWVAFQRLARLVARAVLRAHTIHELPTSWIAPMIRSGAASTAGARRTRLVVQTRFTARSTVQCSHVLWRAAYVPIYHLDVLLAAQADTLQLSTQRRAIGVR